MVRSRLAERERKGLHVRIEKLDLELSIGDGFVCRISWYSR
jgi:hypothetical protein